MRENVEHISSTEIYHGQPRNKDKLPINSAKDRKRDSVREVERNRSKETSHDAHLLIYEPFCAKLYFWV